MATNNKNKKPQKKGGKGGKKAGKTNDRLKSHPKFKHQGPAPPGIEMKEWNKAYNSCDSHPTRKKNTDKARKDREEGTTRREAIQKLKDRGELPENFVDEWNGDKEGEEVEKPLLWHVRYGFARYIV